MPKPFRSKFICIFRIFLSLIIVLTTGVFVPAANAANVTLTYDANVSQHQSGVISAGAVPSQGTFAQNSVVTVSANSGNLARQGFTFGGWNTASNGSGTNYIAGTDSFTITTNTILYAKWIIPSSGRLIDASGSIITLSNPNSYANYSGNCNSGLSGITSDGTYIYFRSSLNSSVICKVNLDGTFVSSNPVINVSPTPALSSIDVNNRDLTFSSGCIWVRATGETADSALYCISISDWTIRQVSTPTGKGLFVGSFWLYGNLIDFPDGRIGAVGVGSTTAGQTGTAYGGSNGTTTIACPAAMYCKVLRLYKPTGTGASVSLSFSEDIVLADNTKETSGALTAWPNDDHGIATDGTYLYQIKYASGYKVWALASGSPSYLVFNGSASGSCGAVTGVSNTLCPINTPLINSTGNMGNATFFGHNHVTNQYIMGDYQSNKFYLSGSDAPPAGPGSATGLSALTISAGTLSPTFNSALAIYSDTLTTSTSSITVTPTALDVTGATIKVKVNSGTYATVASGTASASLALNVGMNTVYVQVTGADLSSVVTSISVFRPESATITLTPSYSNTTKTYIDTLTVSISTSVYSPSGTFSFTENGSVISGCSTVAISVGTARCNWTPSTTGSKTVVATYSGDSFVVLKSDTQTVTVNDIVSITSSTALITQKYGAARITRAFTYTGGTDTRTITASSTSLASGKITFDTTTAIFTIDTRTAVGTYYDTITITDLRNSTASYMQTITITVADTLTVTSDTGTVTFTGAAPVFNPSASAVSGLISGDVISGATFTYSASTATCANGGACSLGQTGPGGGLVFITPTTTGNTTGKYFEAAPSGWSGSASDPLGKFCTVTSLHSGALGTAIGTGEANTTVIAGDCISIADTATALVLNGKDDWFIPSLDELHEMYSSLYKATPSVGGFTGVNYWSSSDHPTTSGWALQGWFGSTDGITGWGGTDEAGNYSYRPVRSFVATSTSTVNYGPSVTKPTNVATYVITPSGLTFSSGATSNYANITYRTSTLTIDKAAQATLTVVPIYQAFLSNPTSATMFTTGGSDTGTVTYAYVPSGSTAGGCTLSGSDSSTITVTSEGTCRIVATKAATANYLVAISDTQTVTFHLYISNQPIARPQEYPTEIVLVGENAMSRGTNQAPVITSGTSSAASPGGTITLIGSGFLTTTSVSVCFTSATFTINSDTSLTINVPSGIAGISGPILIENTYGTGFSDFLFTGL